MIHSPFDLMIPVVRNIQLQRDCCFLIEFFIASLQPLVLNHCHFVEQWCFSISSLDLSVDTHVNISTQHFHLKVIVFDKRVMMHNELLHIKNQKFRTNDSQVVSACYLQTKRSQKPEPKLDKNSSTKHFQISKHQNIETIPA